MFKSDFSFDFVGLQGWNEVLLVKHLWDFRENIMWKEPLVSFIYFLDAKKIKELVINTLLIEHFFQSKFKKFLLPVYVYTWWAATSRDSDIQGTVYHSILTLKFTLFFPIYVKRARNLFHSRYDFKLDQKGSVSITSG